MNQSPYAVSQIALWLHAETAWENPDRKIDTLAYDTRKLNGSADTLFFALHGQRDGHTYIPQAYAAGVRNFVVQRNYTASPECADANYLFVDDTLKALQALAARHRQGYSGKVLAITGSNGKTVVKEWLFQLLSPDMEIIRSPKSYNSQIGVALSLWELDNRAPLAIIEAGISQPGEMSVLEEMIAPDYGILTNIKHAHIQNFKNPEGLLQEKLALFKRVERLVFNPGYTAGYDPKHLSSVFTWGNLKDLSSDHLEVGTVSSQEDSGTRITGRFKGQEYSIEIPFSDAASIENAFICWSFLLQMGYEQNVIRERMKTLSPLQMRLALKQGIYQSSIIDDSYSFDVSSLGIALDFLYQQGQHEHRVVILSDLPHTGNRETELYRKVADLLLQKPIHKLIGIGERIRAHRDFFAPMEVRFYSSTSEFIATFPFQEFQNCTLLVKGARIFGFEEIIRHLDLKTHETRLEIDLNALSHNVKQYRSFLPEHTRIMGMVKAFSYGSGSFEIAGQLQFDQIEYLAVAYTDEGVDLRKSGIHVPIMVMNPDLHYFQALVYHKLEPEIYSYELLEALLAYCSLHQIQELPVHIKLETGMNRLGFNGSELPKLLQRLQGQHAVKVMSVFSHLAAAGDPAEDAFTRQQIERFSSGADFLQEGLGYSFLRHIDNSAGIIRFPEAHMDMVRPGIGMYGIAPIASPLSMQPVLSLKTQIAQIKPVQAKDTIGYDRKGRLAAGGTLAVVRIGYADGYDRRLGNGVGHMCIGKHRVPTVGEICMDMCMLDVSGLSVKVGDEVRIFGDDPSIEGLARAAGMIPYELLTGISQRVKRIYYYG